MKFPSWLRAGTWTLVVALGVGAVAVLAMSRSEPVSALWMVVAALCTFAVAYRFHSAVTPCCSTSSISRSEPRKPTKAR